MTIPIGYHELRDRLEHWRPTNVSDDMGGSEEVLTRVGDIKAKVSQPEATEQIEAMQAGSALTMVVHFRPDADVRRGDVLVRSDGDQLRVKYALHPSERVYLRASVEQIQSEGELQ